MKKLLRAVFASPNNDENQNDHVSRQGDLLGKAKFFATVRSEVR
jgi:hypothetical protein